MFHNILVEWKRRRRKKMATIERMSFITAYTWIFGCSKKVAATVYREEKAKKNAEYIKNVIACFNSNAKRAFYND